jgi:hypothetical protein
MLDSGLKQIDTMGELPKNVINILTLKRETQHHGILFSQLTDVFHCLP